MNPNFGCPLLTFKEFKLSLDKQEQLRKQKEKKVDYGINKIISQQCRSKTIPPLPTILKYDSNTKVNFIVIPGPVEYVFKTLIIRFME